MTLPKNEQDLQNYSSAFTEENIINVKNVINASINTYSSETLKGKKLDIYVILAALQHASFELIIRAFPKDEDETKAMIKRMEDVANDVLGTVKQTAIREHNGMDTLLGTVHASSILAESIARNRDKYIEVLRTQQQEAEAERTSVPTNTTQNGQDEA